MYVLSLGLLLAVLAAPVHGDGPARLLLSGGSISVAGANQAPDRGEICIRGQLTDEGIECPALRGESGVLYTLAGDTGGFEVGDEVCVCGTVAEVSFCMQGTTIASTHISSGEQGCPP
ncbi:MAG: DUF5818 domain-containing protein [Rhodospirillales bacterium]|nr:DUF5818 domain-containing protein [Rhodospirillales bacterium]